jgi:hypothetical protein
MIKSRPPRRSSSSKPPGVDRAEWSQIVPRYEAESQFLIDNPELNDGWSHAYSDPDNPHVKLYDMMVQTSTYKIVNDEKVKPG